MTSSSATNCARCGALRPSGATSAGSLCLACGQPLDPDATWRPAAGPVAPPVTSVAMPARLPLAGLALLGIICALMGLGLGIWLGWGRSAPGRQAAATLPPLPPPGPPVARPLPARQFYPAPSAAAPLSLPPARVTPPVFRRGSQALGRWGRGSDDARAAFPPSPAHPPVSPAPRLPVGPGAPLKSDGMATVRVDNPSAAAVGVTLSGRGGPIGVVAPHASIDFLLPPGRYDIALHGPARTQRIYDAPLQSGDVLALVYSPPPEERPDTPARSP